MKKISLSIMFVLLSFGIAQADYFSSDTINHNSVKAITKLRTSIGDVKTNTANTFAIGASTVITNDIQASKKASKVYNFDINSRNDGKVIAETEVGISEMGSITGNTISNTAVGASTHVTSTNPSHNKGLDLIITTGNRVGGYVYAHADIKNNTTDHISANTVTTGAIGGSATVISTFSGNKALPKDEKNEETVSTFNRGQVDALTYMFANKKLDKNTVSTFAIGAIADITNTNGSNAQNVSYDVDTNNDPKGTVSAKSILSTNLKAIHLNTVSSTAIGASTTISNVMQ
jgi:hypothetical protein